MVSHAILVKFLVPWPTGYPLAGQACHRSTSTSICHTTDGRRWRLRLIRFSEGNSHLFLHACDCVTPWSIYHVGIFLLVGHQNEICQTRMWNWRTCFFTACQFKLMLLHSTNHSNWFLKFPVFNLTYQATFSATAEVGPEDVRVPQQACSMLAHLLSS